ncbi:MAG: glycosyltransferase family 2 protein, partial [Actinomycetota bacterium]
GIAPGAMPWLHRYIGNPVLSFVGRLFFRAPVRDFHCGLRAFRRESIVGLHLRTTGMEFASEMVVKACVNGLQVSEVPTPLRPDGRTRAPHLRSFRDGWRHLRFLLLFSPRWLFLYPGLLLMALGLVFTGFLVSGPIEVGGVGFDVGALLYMMALTVVGYQAVLFALLGTAYARAEGFLPAGDRFEKLERRFSLERSVLIGGLVFLFGIGVSVFSFLRWRDVGFGALQPEQSVRTVTPAVLGLVLGAQTIMGGVFLSFLGIRVARVDSL